MTLEETEIKKTLKCNDETAKKIAKELYMYACPDWSEATRAELKADFLMVAELAKIKIVKI